ncbi:AmmeMemoRadiSam system protein B [bacterium]|nr:AmmeMemoRadiSam system protein B [bacterium]
MSESKYDLPRLRPIEAFPVSMDGQQMYAIRDQRSEDNEVTVVSPEFLFILTLCNGQNTLRDIQYLFTKQYGSIIGLDQIEELLEQIDQRLLLDSIHYAQHLERQKQAYRELAVRPAMFQGKSYPEHPEELAELLDSFFNMPGGPGQVQDGRRQAAPVGLVAPHIDFQRGGPCFAHTYKILAEAEDIELFVVLGTDHDESTNRYSVSMKNYDTPFGVAEVDRDFITHLQSGLDFDLGQDEYNHKREHSIEFQTIFLKYLYLHRPAFTIVPILCGSFLEIMARAEKPEDNCQVSSFIRALSDALLSAGKRTCLIAAVDFSHVGLQFGAARPLAENQLDPIMQEDLKLINALSACDRTQFYDLLFRTKNQNNVCGVSPLYTLISVIAPARGTLLHHDYWYDQSAGSMVSFASMVFASR